MKSIRITASACLLLASAACGRDTVTDPGLDRATVAGVYNLTAFSFDPQGSLPPVDIRTRLGTQVAPQMIVTLGGLLQFIAQDPVTGLTITANGTYTTTVAGIAVLFDSNAPYRQLLLSRQMEFTFTQQANTLTFSGVAPDGVLRARLVALVPELQNEQLLDPTPGTLAITLVREG